MNFYQTEIQADRLFPLQTTCMAKSTFRKNTAKTSLNSLLIHCAARNLIHVGFTELRVQYAKTYRFAHLKTETKMWTLARKANLGDNPLYHFLTLPDPRVIDEVSVDMLRQWHKQTFTQSGLTIVVTGAISRQDAGSSVDTLLFDLPKGRVSPPHDVNVTIKPQTVFLHVPEAEKTTIGILGRLPPTSQGNDLTDLLALSHFSQNGSGPLFSALRTEQRVSYGFQAGFFDYNRKNRLLIITGAVAADQAADVAADIAEIYEE
jgi:predicted Zn-dependent peptidase